MFPVVLNVVAVDVHVAFLIGCCHDNVSRSYVFVEICEVRDSSSHTHQQHVLQGAKRSYNICVSIVRYGPKNSNIGY